MKWFRMYHEARTDEKLKSLTDAEFRVWFRLMCYANEQEPRGVVATRTKRLMAVEVAQGDVELYERTIEILQELEIVVVTDSSIQITHWDKRQYASDESTKRWQKWNEKQKSNVGQTLGKQESNVGQTETQHQLTPPDTDTESDPEVDNRKTNSGGDHAGPTNLEVRIQRAYEQALSTMPSEAQVSRLSYWCDTKGMEGALVLSAIQNAGEKAKGLDYIVGILRNQYERGIRTVAQAQLDDMQHQTAAGGEKSGKHSNHTRQVPEVSRTANGRKFGLVKE